MNGWIKIILKDDYQVESHRDLTKEQADEFIRRLEGKGNESGDRK